MATHIAMFSIQGVKHRRVQSQVLIDVVNNMPPRTQIDADYAVVFFVPGEKAAVALVRGQCVVTGAWVPYALVMPHLSKVQWSI